MLKSRKPYGREQALGDSFKKEGTRSRMNSSTDHGIEKENFYKQKFELLLDDKKKQVKKTNDYLRKITELTE